MINQKRIYSKWVIFTGPPSSGKTTILEILKNKGHPVISEVARDCLMEGVKQGNSVHLMRGTESDFQHIVFNKRLQVENNLNSHRKIILDRSLLDSYAYYLFLGTSIDDSMKALFCKYIYNKVFFFEQLPIIRDGFRTETVQESHLLSVCLLNTYKSFGYSPINVPIFSDNKEKSIQRRLGLIENLL